MIVGVAAPRRLAGRRVGVQLEHPPDVARAVEAAGTRCSRTATADRARCRPKCTGRWRSGTPSRSPPSAAASTPASPCARRAVRSRSTATRTAGARAGMPRPPGSPASSGVPGQVSQASDGQGALIRPPIALTICSVPKPLGTNGCQPSAARRPFSCGDAAAEPEHRDHAAVELELRDRARRRRCRRGSSRRRPPAGRAFPTPACRSA